MIKRLSPPLNIEASSQMSARTHARIETLSDDENEFFGASRVLDIRGKRERESEREVQTFLVTADCGAQHRTHIKEIEIVSPLLFVMFCTIHKGPRPLPMGDRDDAARVLQVRAAWQRRGSELEEADLQGHLAPR